VTIEAPDSLLVQCLLLSTTGGTNNAYYMYKQIVQFCVLIYRVLGKIGQFKLNNSMLLESWCFEYTCNV